MACWPLACRRIRLARPTRLGRRKINRIRPNQHQRDGCHQKRHKTDDKADTIFGLADLQQHMAVRIRQGAEAEREAGQNDKERDELDHGEILAGSLRGAREEFHRLLAQHHQRITRLDLAFETVAPAGIGRRGRG